MSINHDPKLLSFDSLENGAVFYVCVCERQRDLFIVLIMMYPCLPLVLSLGLSVPLLSVSMHRVFHVHGGASRCCVLNNSRGRSRGHAFSKALPRSVHFVQITRDQIEVKKLRSAFLANK